MSYVDSNQPDGTPTWIDLGIPDLHRAMAFYHALFGWEYDVGTPETGHYTMCKLRGRQVAALAPTDEGSTEHWWNVYFATSDCDGTAKRITDAGGSLIVEPMDVMTHGRMAMVKDPVGSQFGLWQGRDHVGCQIVNEPNSLVRNDLITPQPGPARAFYQAVFDFTLDGNDAMPGLDFTFLRRPDGHEVGGIIGSSTTTKSEWNVTFEVTDTDAVVAAAIAGGGTATAPEEMPYGRMAVITDPFGAELTVVARPTG